MATFEIHRMPSGGCVLKFPPGVCEDIPFARVRHAALVANGFVGSTPGTLRVYSAAGELEAERQLPGDEYRRAIALQIRLLEVPCPVSRKYGRRQERWEQQRAAALRALDRLTDRP